MKHLKSFQEKYFSVNEAKEEKKVDFAKKFAKKLEETSKLIDQAKKDDVSGVEVDSTWESVYDFHKIWIEKDKLKCSYTEVYGSKKDKEKTETINLKKDADIDFEEAKYLFSWVKKCIKKGYREDGKSLSK